MLAAPEGLPFLRDVAVSSVLSDPHVPPGCLREFQHKIRPLYTQCDLNLLGYNCNWILNSHGIVTRLIGQQQSHDYGSQSSRSRNWSLGSHMISHYSDWLSIIT